MSLVASYVYMGLPVSERPRAHLTAVTLVSWGGSFPYSHLMKELQSYLRMLFKQNLKKFKLETCKLSYYPWVRVDPLAAFSQMLMINQPVPE